MQPGASAPVRRSAHLTLLPSGREIAVHYPNMLFLSLYGLSPYRSQRVLQARARQPGAVYGSCRPI